MFVRVWKLIVTAGLLASPSMAQDVPRPPLNVVEQPPAVKPNPDATGVYHSGPGMVMPKVTYSKEPDFSEKARKKKINGVCSTSLIVDAQGIPQNVHVIRSIAETNSPKDRKAALSLDDKAVEAVKQYRFSPATYQGKVVPVEVKIDISFQIF